MAHFEELSNEDISNIQNRISELQDQYNELSVEQKHALFCRFALLSNYLATLHPNTIKSFLCTQCSKVRSSKQHKCKYCSYVSCYTCHTQEWPLYRISHSENNIELTRIDTCPLCTPNVLGRVQYSTDDLRPWKLIYENLAQRYYYFSNTLTGHVAMIYRDKFYREYEIEFWYGKWKLHSPLNTIRFYIKNQQQRNNGSTDIIHTSEEL